MEAREKLNEFAELRGWNKNKLIGWSEAADFGEWLVKNNAKLQPVSTRYFIVFYKAQFEGMLSDGQIDINVTGETPFLNRKKCFEVIKNQNPKVLELIITNFIEVTKDEYVTWRS